ncbi:lysozyme inhibitor LprI family protein [Enterovirga aerilata]|uniref:DUF1311 domain-containing protein n=1 Tax=Enterovirga aerilata TaxID=2730920 RepID=A0A849I6Q9_9HYPH|nr:lysozyme inhibitor LprI family protein [Enterovirga sp. DB1703]NNM73068.1 DUF1311 domain-containing protein [Enterovirga sp. DB1703]
MRFGVVMSVAGLLAAGQAAAQGSGAPEVNCKDPQGTPEINYCAEQEYRRADARLNAAYRAMIGRIDASDDYDDKTKAALKAAIQDAQRKWIAFRDADCIQAVGTSWNGGTGTGYAVETCLKEKTLARAKELEGRPQN